MKFELINTNDKARLGRLTFDRGEVNTPAFMPVGTYGAVKAMTVEEVSELGAEIILGNTFHLSITPSTEVIEAHGDLHDFMNWQGPILTDSGGFQVFSLGKMRKITEEGVAFRSPKDGSSIFMGPEESMNSRIRLQRLPITPLINRYSMKPWAVEACRRPVMQIVPSPCPMSLMTSSKRSSSTPDWCSEFRVTGFTSSRASSTFSLTLPCSVASFPAKFMG